MAKNKMHEPGWKCPHGQQVFVVSVSLQRLKMYSNQKNEFRFLFGIKDLDCKMKDWWQITSHLKASCFNFACLMTELLCQLQFVCFFLCRRKLFTTTEPTVTWTSIAWHFLTWRHDPFRNPDSFFFTDSRSTSLGVAGAGTLKLDLWALNVGI